MLVQIDSVNDLGLSVSLLSSSCFKCFYCFIIHLGASRDFENNRYIQVKILNQFSLGLEGVKVQLKIIMKPR